MSFTRWETASSHEGVIEGLSRMKGNFHVRFLGEGMRGNTLPLPDNLTSQFWANCYLDSFDHFVKRELRCPAYLRYVDDALLFGDDKRQLWDWKGAVMERMARLRLTIHEERAQVRPVAEGFPFLGFVVYPHKRRLKRRKGVAYARKFQALVEDYADGRLSLDQVTASVQGWVNHARYGDTLGLRRTVLENVIVPAPSG